jgi:hypothetical protein
MYKTRAAQSVNYIFLCVRHIILLQNNRQSGSILLQILSALLTASQTAHPQPLKSAFAYKINADFPDSL